MWWLTPVILFHGGWNRKTAVTDCVDQASPWLPSDGFKENQAENDCSYPSQRNDAAGLTGHKCSTSTSNTSLVLICQLFLSFFPT